MGEGWVQYDIDRQAVPLLAESWSISKDFTTWTIKVRRGVQFHKGYGEMTAEDVAWSMNQWRENVNETRTNVMEWYWNHPEGSFETPDDYTVVVDTGVPMPDYQYLDIVRTPGGQYVASKKQTEEIGAEAANENIATTGPWEIVEHKTGEFWKMRAVEDHCRKTPHFAEMVFWEIKEEASRLAGFQTGNLDTFTMSYDSIPAVLEVPGAKIMRVPNAASMNLRIYGQDYAEVGTPDQRAAYNPDLPWVSASSDVNSPQWERASKVRWALMYAIDIQTIIDTILGGYAEPGGVTFFENHQHLLDPDTKWEYDLERAKQLLAEAGYPGGGFSLTLTIAIRGAPSEVPVCQAIASMWRDIGIDVKFVNVPFATMRPSIVGRTYQGVTCHAGSPAPTPAQGFNGLSIKGSIYGITHPYLEDRVYKAMEAVDPAERQRLEGEVGRFLYDGAHVRSLYTYDNVYPVGSRIEDWSEGITYGDLRYQSGFEWIRHRQ
jgi:peptide/nickel transport system substrate-binding protein